MLFQRAITQACRDQGIYTAGSSEPSTPPCSVPPSVGDRQQLPGMTRHPMPRVNPGLCLPWKENAKELPEITGDRDLIRGVWEAIEGLGNTCIWQLLLSFRMHSAERFEWCDA